MYLLLILRLFFLKGFEGVGILYKKDKFKFYKIYKILIFFYLFYRVN